MKTAKIEVLVAMSGGVDSSVAAALLLDAGYAVTGVTLKLWGGESDSGCCAVSDVEDARRVAHRLGIDHHVFNFGQEFNEHVIDPYVAAYDAGRTPNPCIECNRHIKFDKLLRRADVLGFELLATGHHAAVTVLPDGSRRISRGADAAKDQSYVLYMLDQAVQARLLLPLGSMTKDRVRELAHELGLVTAAKPDSQDVCFIHSDGGRRAFLGDRIPLTPATIVDRSGQTLGRTETVQLVTIGQRKGLGLAGNDDRNYVVDIDRTAGVVTVGPESETFVGATELTDVGWTAPVPEGRYLVQCSAHGSCLPATIAGTTITWDTPHRRVASGQAVVFYDGAHVVGGAIAA